MTSQNKEILILGLGNILLKDEGLGVYAAGILKNKKLPPDVEVLEGATGGFDLIDVIANRKKVIVIDSCDFGQQPGTIGMMKSDDILASKDSGISMHEFGLAEALNMAKIQECSPGEVVIIAVQPGDISPGLELSQQIQKAMPKVIETVMKLFD